MRLPAARDLGRSWSAVLIQPNAQLFQSLRLSVLARYDRAVAVLMTRQGWLDHEALCAVKQRKEEALLCASEHHAP